MMKLQQLPDLCCQRRGERFAYGGKVIFRGDELENALRGLGPAQLLFQ